MAGKDRVGELLVQAGVIDDLQLRSAHAQQASWGHRLTQILVDKKFATEDAIASALANALGLQRMSLGASHDAAALHKLDAKFCKEKGLFPVALRDGSKTLLVVMADPTDMELQDEIGRRSRTRVSVAVAGEAEIQTAIDRHYFGKEPVLTGLPQRSLKGATLSEEAPGEQFKVTDLSGKTVLGLTDSGKAKAPTPAPTPEAESMLDELLGGAAPPTLSEEDLARVRSIQENQDKAGKILQALTELLREKGIT